MEESSCVSLHKGHFSEVWCGVIIQLKQCALGLSCPQAKPFGPRDVGLVAKVVSELNDCRIEVASHFEFLPSA